MSILPRLSRTALPLMMAYAAAVGCRERTDVPPVDSTLAQDLAMAQRPGPGPEVFNDAPIGASAPAAPAPARPTPRPQPPRTPAPRPRPVPRRTSPPARIAEAPRAPEQRAEEPESRPAPAPAPTPAAGVIGAGSRIGMTINARVCTNTALAGDKFTATATSATIGSNGAHIPAGATVVIEVASIDRADPVENSRIEFRVRAIDVNGSARPVDGDVATLASLESARSAAGNEKTKVVGGAVAGAVLGQIFGRSTKSTVIGAAAGAAAGTAAARASRSTYACLPEGSALRLTLSRDLVVRRGEI